MPIHHLQLWVPDLERAERSWGWLLSELGYTLARQWEHGRVYRDGGTGVVIEASPDMVPGMLYSRLRPGMNHVAFEAASPEAITALVAAAPDHGWTELEPHAHHRLPAELTVAFLEDVDGFEVELIART